MNNILKAMIVAMFLAGLAGCEPEGPAERAGAEIDEAVEDAGNAVEDACEDVKEAAGADDTDC